MSKVDMTEEEVMAGLREDYDLLVSQVDQMWANVGENLYGGIRLSSFINAMCTEDLELRQEEWDNIRMCMTLVLKQAAVWAIKRERETKDGL